MLSKNQLIIITWRNGSGKSTVVQYIEEHYDAYVFRPSDMTRRVLREFGIEETRENLSKMMTVLRREFTPWVYLLAAHECIEKQKGKTIIFDGIRKSYFIDDLRKLWARVIFISADSKARYNRISKRWDKDWEKNLSLEKFHADELLESENELDIIEKNAGDIIENNGSFEELFERIDIFLKK